MKLTRARTPPEDKSPDRFTVMDFAEAAEIPVSKARRLIKDLGYDAETLMKAIGSTARMRARS